MPTQLSWIEQGFCKAQVIGSSPIVGLLGGFMVINLWYNKQMKEWRWSLTETSVMAQHTGGQEKLRDAMNDVANTVEYILDNELKEG